MQCTNEPFQFTKGHELFGKQKFFRLHYYLFPHTTRSVTNPPQNTFTRNPFLLWIRFIVLLKHECGYKRIVHLNYSTILFNNKRSINPRWEKYETCAHLRRVKPVYLLTWNRLNVFTPHRCPFTLLPFVIVSTSFLSFRIFYTRTISTLGDDPAAIPPISARRADYTNFRTDVHISM